MQTLEKGWSCKLHPLFVEKEKKEWFWQTSPLDSFWRKKRISLFTPSRGRLRLQPPKKPASRQTSVETCAGRSPHRNVTSVQPMEHANRIQKLLKATPPKGESSRPTRHGLRLSPEEQGPRVTDTQGSTTAPASNGVKQRPWMSTPPAGKNLLPGAPVTTSTFPRGRRPDYDWTWSDIQRIDVSLWFGWSLNGERRSGIRRGGGHRWDRVSHTRMYVKAMHHNSVECRHFLSYMHPWRQKLECNKDPFHHLSSNGCQDVGSPGEECGVRDVPGRRQRLLEGRGGAGQEPAARPVHLTACRRRAPRRARGAPTHPP